MRFAPFLGVFMMFGVTADAALTPDQVRTADNRKTLQYLKDGLVVGGDRAIDDVVVKSIRRAANPGFDRVVIDLEGTLNGESAAIGRPPFYHIAVSPEERRVVVTLFGRPRLEFDSAKVAKAFRKSPVVSSLELLPRLEPESWTFVIGLKSNAPVEVFELADPVRIILDIKAPRS